MPEADRPPVGWVRNSFQLMVGIGTLLSLALLVIVPSIAVLFRLTLHGRLSERFGPIVPADDGGDR